MGPVLSICIPTHHGRAAELRTAIRSIIDPGTPDQAGRVEICVSDNASQDATREVVDRARTDAAVPIRYHRFERDMEPPRNIAAAVNTASAPWCWILSSDDALAPDAIPRVLDVLDAHADVTAVTVDRVNMDRDLSAPVDQDPEGFAPPEGGHNLWLSPDEIIGRLGSTFRYLSAHIVRRSAWQDALESCPPWEVTRFYPQLIVLAQMAQQDPAWVWLGQKLVLHRTHNQAVHELIGAGEERLHTTLPADVKRCWAAIAGRHSKLYRRMMAVELDLAAPVSVLRALKRRSGHPWRTDARLLTSLTRTFWRQPAFWRSRLPVLLTPAVMERRRAAAARTLPSPPLEPAACRARLTATLPRHIRQRHQLVLPCDIQNLGAATLASSPPNPVYVSYRWTDPDTGELMLEGIREAFPRPLQPGELTSVPVRVLGPWDARPATLRLSLMQERVGWWEDVHPEHALVGMVDVTE